MLEKALISGVVHQREETVYRVSGAKAARLFGALAEASVNVDTLVQKDGEIVFSVSPVDAADASDVLAATGGEWSSRDDLGKVSLIGAGMRSHPGVAYKTFKALGDAGVNIEMISTSPIKISCVVREEDVTTAVRELHQVFELGPEAVKPEDVAGVHRPVVQPEEAGQSPAGFGRQDEAHSDQGAGLDAPRR
jgi:aspartate kinase